MKRRAYQEFSLRQFILHRTSIRFWCRQAGKTTNLADVSLFDMMKHPRRLVTFATATLLLGRELIMKDSATFQDMIQSFRAEAEQQNMKFQVHDHDKPGKDLTAALTPDDFTQVFEAKRLEFWLYHDRTTFSRTQVIAPNVATARGWSGTVLLDEIGDIPDFGDLFTAMEPIISSDPDFHLVMSGTPPKDDTHASYPMFLPPIGIEFAQPDPDGHEYRNEYQIPVHRVDIHDAVAAGKKVYHLVTGKEVDTAESRRSAPDKDGWDRNYNLSLKAGGTAAIGLLQLDTAQRRGVEQCAFFYIDTDSDLDEAIAFLAEHLGAGQVGVGWDLASTTKDTSNPSSVTVCEKIGVEKINHLICAWKTSNPDIQKERVGRILNAIATRNPTSHLAPLTSPLGRAPARRLCIDATNERLFAQDCAHEFGSEVPVELVIGSETIEVPGEEEAFTMKQYLGSRLVAEFDDNHIILPPERYVKDDMRLVKKDRGQFVCDPAPDGRHGDTFDSTKLADWALSSTQGAIETMTGIRLADPKFSPRYIPRHLKERALFTTA
jgi:hypothetical protein